MPRYVVSGRLCDQKSDLFGTAYLFLQLVSLLLMLLELSLKLRHFICQLDAATITSTSSSINTARTCWYLIETLHSNDGLGIFKRRIWTIGS